MDVKVILAAVLEDPELRLFQYTADRFTRLRFLAATRSNACSSADFLRKLTAWYARRGIRWNASRRIMVFEFTNRFFNSKARFTDAVLK